MFYGELWDLFYSETSLPLWLRHIRGNREFWVLFSALSCISLGMSLIYALISSFEKMEEYLPPSDGDD